MEFRLYAEDAGKNFAPSIGKILALTVPQGLGVRLDLGIYEGFDVPIHYDPMLGKLIVWAENRELCIARAKRVLEEMVLHGPVHNLPFHRWALDQEAFVDGTYTTNFVAEKFDGATYLPELDEGQTQALIAAVSLFEAKRRTQSPECAPQETNVSSWRLNARRTMTNNK